MKRTAHIGWLLLTAALLAACNKQEAGPTIMPQQESVGLVIRASQTMSTRTEPGAVGSGEKDSAQPMNWSSDDAFALWAFDQASGTPQLDQTTFRLRNYGGSFDAADFIASADEMPQGTYTYYALYPADAIREGTAVSASSQTFRFEVPAVQHGSHDAAADIMFATTTGRDLPIADSSYNYPEGTSPDEEGWQQPELNFRHLTHMLRLKVSVADFEQPIRRLEIEFPAGTSAAGLAAYNTADETVSAAGDNSATVTVLFDGNDAIASGEERYVWVHVLPCTLAAQSQLKFHAYDTFEGPARELSATIKTEDRQLAGQHVSPVTLELVPSTFTVIFTCPDTTEWPNFLGEEATVLTLTDGDAIEGTTIEVMQHPDFGQGVFLAHFAYDPYGNVGHDLHDKTLHFTLESEHADWSDHTYEYRLASDLQAGKSYTCNYALPYLFFEDFSTANSFNSNGTNSSNSQTGVSLDDYLPQAGWTGNQLYITEKTSITLKDRHEGTAIANGDYSSRLDSAPITRLKEDSDISVKFDYASSVSGTTHDNYRVYMISGGTTTQGPIRAYYSQAGVTYNSKVEGEESTLGSGSNLTSGIKEYTLSNAPAKIQRLSWNIYVTGNSSLTPRSVNYYLTLDNIKVSIGGEVRYPDLDYRSFFPNN